MRNQTLKYLYWILAVTVAILFAVGLAAFHNLQQSNHYSALVTHTNEVILQAEETISALKDAETGMRGYALTHDPNFLDPYYKSLQQIKPALRRLDVLLQGNERQQRRVRQLNDLVNAGFASMNRYRNISVIYPNTDTLYQALVQGRIIMDTTRSVINRIQRDEKNDLEGAIQKESEFTELTPLWLGAISILAVLSFSLSFWAVIRELRKRWRYENQLELAVEDLRETNAELENFVYIASHHFQEPLRKLQTFSDRLMNKHAGALERDSFFMLQRIQSSSARMQQLMDDLLLYLRVGRYKQDALIAVDLQVILQQLVHEHADNIIAARAEVHIDKSWQPVVCGEASQLLALFQQLLDNSLKFVRENDVPVIKIRTFVTIGVDVPGSSREDMHRKFCRIEFSDNGIGFDPGYSEKIFQLFQRLHHLHEYSGTGIGLAICKKIVTNHRGYLQVQSEIGTGTTFYIYLPLNN